MQPPQGGESSSSADWARKVRSPASHHSRTDQHPEAVEREHESQERSINARRRRCCRLFRGGPVSSRVGSGSEVGTSENRWPGWQLLARPEALPLHDWRWVGVFLASVRAMRAGLLPLGAYPPIAAAVSPSRRWESATFGGVVLAQILGERHLCAGGGNGHAAEAPGAPAWSGAGRSARFGTVEASYDRPDSQERSAAMQSASTGSKRRRRLYRSIAPWRSRWTRRDRKARKRCPEPGGRVCAHQGDQHGPADNGEHRVRGSERSRRWHLGEARKGG